MGHVARESELQARELIEDFCLVRLGEVGEMSINQFRFEPGAEVPVHSHEQAQIGYIIRGELTQMIADETYTLGPGDTYFLESNDPHGAVNEGDEPVEGLDIFNPPRAAPNWNE